MFYMRVEGSDCIPVHTRPPQRVLPERPVLGVEIFLPQRRRLDDMAVAVEHYEILGSHPFLRLYASPLVNVIVARRAMQSRCVASQSRDETASLSRRDGAVKAA